MSSFHSVVTEQRVFICAVCAFIDKLLRAVLPDIAWDNTFLVTEEKLGALLDDVIQRCTLKRVEEGDCCIAMAQKACNAMKPVCELLRVACSTVGLEDKAEKYLAAQWFVKLLLRKNSAMLNKLCYGIDFTDEKPSRILMNVAAILNGKEDGYNAMNANAKRKADRETKELIKEVEKKIDESKTELATKIDDGNKMIAGKVESVREELRNGFQEYIEAAKEIIAKIEKSKRSKRKGKHTPEQKTTCLSVWMSAEKNVELKSGSKTGKATFAATFQYYKRELELAGVRTVKKFADVIHTIQNDDYNARIKELEAKQEAARKAAKKSGVQTAKKCGIMRAVKKTSRCAFAIAAATIGVLASPLRSDAVPMQVGGGVSPLAQRGVAPFLARPGASCAWRHSATAPIISAPSAAECFRASNKVPHLAAALDLISSCNFSPPSSSLKSSSVGGGESLSPVSRKSVAVIGKAGLTSKGYTA